MDGRCLQVNNVRWTFEIVFECVRASETRLRLLRDAAGDEEECTATEEKYGAVLVTFFVCLLTPPGNDTTHDTRHTTHDTRHTTHDTHDARFAERLTSRRSCYFLP